MSAIDVESKAVAKATVIKWPSILWVAGLHAGALLAPFVFTWSGLAICASLYVFTGLGITLGYHRLLTHRSFYTPKVVEYFWATLGVLANQGGPLSWVADHREHHAHGDQGGDPHSPNKGFWWAHMVWWMHADEPAEGSIAERQIVKDLASDRYYRFLERWQLLPPIVLAALLFSVGQFWLGTGLSWLIWGMFVRTVLVDHATWLVNSATHIWGYRNFATRDRSTNLWWVALLTFGEGWHNNHHAFQRSARHGLRWWELDVTFLVIRLLSFLGLARDIRVAPSPVKDAEAENGDWRIIKPRQK